MKCTVEPNGEVKLMGSTERGSLELLKVWITKLLVMFMRCLIRSNVLQDLLNKLFVVGC